LCHNQKKTTFAARLKCGNNLKICTVKTLSYKTQSAKHEEVARNWYVVDAGTQVVGRLSTKIATVLRGKHKAEYTPHVDTGDYVIVVNADKVRFTGNKMNAKEYQRYSGYPGGQKSRTAAEMLEKKPEAIIESAVRGMLPKTRLGRQMIKKLFIYAGPEHPHAAQKPEQFNF
jgi:large subunit ribosomal protein L13